MQHRQGPNMNGPFGLLQSLADGMKLMFKEDFTPTAADRVVFMLAPFVVAIPAITAFAVIPIAGEVQVPFTDITTPLQVTDLPVSVLFIVAIASIGVYGIVLAGWSSGSTYALLGALRSSAQVISYEVAMGLALVAVFLYAESLSTSEIVAAQAEPTPVFGIPLWYAVQLIPSFVIYLISMVGETNRAPFDLPEAEGELVGGFHTEYSSMRFAMFFMAEYMNMITVSALAVTLFLGGWHAPFPFNLIPGADSGYWGVLWFVRQGPGHAVHLRLAARDAAAAALRPVHAVRLEVADPDLAGLDADDRRACGSVSGRAVQQPDGAGSCSVVVFLGLLALAFFGGGKEEPEEAGPAEPASSTPSPAATRCRRRATRCCPSSPPCCRGRAADHPRIDDADAPGDASRRRAEQSADGFLRSGRGLRRDLQDDVPQDLHHRLPERRRG